MHRRVSYPQDGGRLSASHRPPVAFAKQKHPSPQDEHQRPLTIVQLPPQAAPAAAEHAHKDGGTNPPVAMAPLSPSEVQSQRVMELQLQLADVKSLLALRESLESKFIDDKLAFRRSHPDDEARLTEFLNGKAKSGGFSAPGALGAPGGPAFCESAAWSDVAAGLLKRHATLMQWDKNHGFPQQRLRLLEAELRKLLAAVSAQPGMVAGGIADATRPAGLAQPLPLLEPSVARHAPRERAPLPPRPKLRASDVRDAARRLFEDQNDQDPNGDEPPPEWEEPAAVLHVANEATPLEDFNKRADSLDFKARTACVEFIGDLLDGKPCTAKNLRPFKLESVQKTLAFKHLGRDAKVLVEGFFSLDPKQRASSGIARDVGKLGQPDLIPAAARPVLSKQVEQARQLATAEELARHLCGQLKSWGYAPGTAPWERMGDWCDLSAASQDVQKLAAQFQQLDMPSRNASETMRLVKTYLASREQKASSEPLPKAALVKPASPQALNDGGGRRPHEKKKAPVSAPLEQAPQVAPAQPVEKTPILPGAAPSLNGQGKAADLLAMRARLKKQQATELQLQASVRLVEEGMTMADKFGPLKLVTELRRESEVDLVKRLKNHAGYQEFRPQQQRAAEVYANISLLKFNSEKSVAAIQDLEKEINAAQGVAQPLAVPDHLKVSQEAAIALLIELYGAGTADRPFKPGATEAAWNMFGAVGLKKLQDEFQAQYTVLLDLRVAASVAAELVNAEQKQRCLALVEKVKQAGADRVLERVRLYPDFVGMPEAHQLVVEAYAKLSDAKLRDKEESFWYSKKVVLSMARYEEAQPPLRDQTDAARTLRASAQNGSGDPQGAQSFEEKRAQVAMRQEGADLHVLNAMLEQTRQSDRELRVEMACLLELAPQIEAGVDEAMQAFPRLVVTLMPPSAELTVQERVMAEPAYQQMSAPQQRIAEHYALLADVAYRSEENAQRIEDLEKKIKAVRSPA